MVDLASSGAPSLAQLRDLQLPDPVGFWPPAPGWWLLALITLAALAWLSVTARRRYQRSRYRRLALAELEQLATPAAASPCSEWLQQLNQLLRRTALAAYSDATVAHLSGNHWSDFLNRSGPSADWSLLIDTPYRANPTLTLEEQQRLLQQCRNWIRQHHAHPPASSEVR